jgi:alpha-L-fucosidase
MGIYYSLYEWYNPLYLSDKRRYVDEHMMPQFKDVVTHYKPSIIFSDGEWDMTSEQWRSPELLAWLYNESPVKNEVVVDDRWGSDTRHKHGGYWTTESTRPVWPKRPTPGKRAAVWASAMATIAPSASSITTQAASWY